jgi:hypothetical protein
MSNKLSPEILADLARSGLDANDAAQMLIFEVSEAELRAIFGRKTAKRARKAPVYAIPYSDSFCRFRFLDGDSEQPKYLQTPNSGARLYFSRDIVSQSRNPDDCVGRLLEPFR